MDSSQVNGGVEELAEEIQEARRGVKHRARQVARAGYIADGFVYIIVGYLALRAAMGPADANVSREEALRQLITAPLGRLGLIVVALGMVGYTLGHFFMATRPAHKEDGGAARSAVNRLAHVVNGIIHLSLATMAAQAGLGIEAGSGNTPEDWTALLLAQPLGRVLVGIGAVTIAGLALYQFYKAFTAPFRQVLMKSKMSEKEEAWIVGAGRFGYGARGIVYGIVAFFLLQATLQYDPQQAGGFGQALATLSTQPYGPWLLGIVAAGLLAFGLYVVFLGRYRRFKL